MTVNDWIGAIGVSILLAAYFMNLRNYVQRDGLVYLLMNFGGATIACIASVLLNYWPFIVLEGCWALVSVVGILNYLKQRKA